MKSNIYCKRIGTLFGLLFFLAPLFVKSSTLYEFRGVWVATTHNIDWPSKQGLTVSDLKKEILNILDLHKSVGMNCIILQVRAAGDSFYHSNLEPWSKFITGVQGKAPDEGFDPLQFWVAECKKRDIEIHAWINPFRAGNKIEEELHSNHPARVNPNWVVNHNNKLYFNPGLKEVRNHIQNVIKDIVTRYDIDGLHIDDYFYPYPVKNVEFNDSDAYNQFIKAGNKLSINDWRRENINNFIQETQTNIKEIKPWIKFGVSPFGVWRNKIDDPRGSDSRGGLTCYDNLYADVLKWVKEGWVDYLAPQIYWSTVDEVTNYTKLIKWWNNEVDNRHLYIGHALYKVNSGQVGWNGSGEILQQLNQNKGLPNIKGSIFFSHNHFNKDNHYLIKTIQNNYYKEPALTPPMAWLSTENPLPVVNTRYKKRIISWQKQKTGNILNEEDRFIVFYRKNGSDNEKWVITNNKFIRPDEIVKNKKGRYFFEIAVINRLNVISNRSKAIKVNI